MWRYYIFVWLHTALHIIPITKRHLFALSKFLNIFLVFRLPKPKTQKNAKIWILFNFVLLSVLPRFLCNFFVVWGSPNRFSLYKRELFFFLRFVFPTWREEIWDTYLSSVSSCYVGIRTEVKALTSQRAIFGDAWFYFFSDWQVWKIMEHKLLFIFLFSYEYSQESNVARFCNRSSSCSSWIFNDCTRC